MRVIPSGNYLGDTLVRCLLFLFYDTSLEENKQMPMFIVFGLEGSNQRLYTFEGSRLTITPPRALQKKENYITKQIVGTARIENETVIFRTQYW